jgi:hypothetical protein
MAQCGFGCFDGFVDVLRICGLNCCDFLFGAGGVSGGTVGGTEGEEGDLRGVD